ncbi:hypothetical protein KKB83_05555 [Patescibacteria group bacterium]|nr:hypothetical protein [Patescibacteria group bacterium]
MEKKQFSHPPGRVQRYLAEVSLDKNSTERECKKVFLQNLEKYFKGEVSVRFLSALALEILYNILLPRQGSSEDLNLKFILDTAEDLSYWWSKCPQLAESEDELKEYLKKNKHFLRQKEGRKVKLKK